LRSAVANGWRVWKHAGFSYALIWLLDRVLYRFGFQIFIVSIHDREWLLSLSPPRVPPYEFRWATREEVLAAAADLEPEWMELPRVSAALERGERCTAAFLGGRLVSCTWSARSGGLCKGLEINVPPNCVYGHEAKTRAGHRGKGLYAALVLTSARAAGEEGKEMVGYVYAGNSRAVCGSARMGKMRRGVVVCREGKRPWSWVSPVCRREGIWVSRVGLP
jgi:hypothetical protein